MVQAYEVMPLKICCAQTCFQQHARTTDTSSPPPTLWQTVAVTLCPCHFLFHDVWSSPYMIQSFTHSGLSTKAAYPGCYHRLAVTQLVHNSRYTLRHLLDCTGLSSQASMHYKHQTIFLLRRHKGMRITVPQNNSSMHPDRNNHHAGSHAQHATPCRPSPTSAYAATSQ